MTLLTRTGLSPVNQLSLPLNPQEGKKQRLLLPSPSSKMHRGQVQTLTHTSRGLCFNEQHLLCYLLGEPQMEHHRPTKCGTQFEESPRWLAPGGPFPRLMDE